MTPGLPPVQEVAFHYTAYNESGRRIDSSYQKGQPARTRMGIQGLIPGQLPSEPKILTIHLQLLAVQPQG